MTTDLTHTSARYQHAVRCAYADVIAGRVRRMSYAEIHAALDALWAAVITTKAEPVKPVKYGRIPF